MAPEHVLGTLPGADRRITCRFTEEFYLSPSESAESIRRMWSYADYIKFIADSDGSLQYLLS